jgi:phosphopantothenoylcysteine decarboxylase/phosphopantothenate--cysteine ligase
MPTITFGITGSVAAYKAVETIRLLRQNHFIIEPVLTENGSRFVGEALLQAITGRKVWQNLFDDTPKGGMAHITLGRHDLIVVAPASADFIAKIAHGIADDLLSTVCLGRTSPLLIAPAMNQAMWQNPATQRNIEQLRKDGILIVGPAFGDQACGETGPGRMVEPLELCQWIEAFDKPPILAQKKVLITAGATLEPLDPVRVLSNLSSGKMGFALAKAAFEAKADVTVVAAQTTAPPPFAVRLMRASTALQMEQIVLQEAVHADLFLSVAAVCDFRPEKQSPEKIKKNGEPLFLRLVQNPDILAQVAALPNAPFCVGFALETHDIIHKARAKMAKKNIPMIVANSPQDNLGTEDAILIVITKDHIYPLSKAPKIEQARRLLQLIASSMQS